MTITEALAEIRTIDKRIEKKREFVNTYLWRQENRKDRLLSEGGEQAAVAAARQAIRDLEERKVNLRRAVQRANEATVVVVNGVTRTIADWLVWRRDVAPGRRLHLSLLQRALLQLRDESKRKAVSVVRPGEEPSSDKDVVVNIDEMALVRETEELETVLGDLDGQLSLKNATVQVEL